MTPILSMVQEKTHALTPSVRIHPILWNGFRVLNKAHGLWRWYRKYNLYRNPNNFVQLLGGHALQFTAGDIAIVRIAAQCLSVVTRITDCSQQLTEVHQSSVKLINIFKGKYLPPIKHSWPKSNENSLSPSTVYWIKNIGITLIERVKQVAWEVLQVGKNLGILSMKILDVMDVIYWTPEAGREAVNESLVNVTTWINEAVEHREEIVQGLEQNREIIESLLNGTVLKYDHVYETVKQGLQGVEAARNLADTANHEFFKRIKEGARIFWSGVREVFS